MTPSDSSFESTESTADSIPTKSVLSKQSQALLMRLYTSPVHTTIVRLMGHDTWDEFYARDQLIRLMRHSGVEAVMAAASELITVSHEHEIPVARLKDEVRQFAVGILGRPAPESLNTPPVLRRVPRVPQSDVPPEMPAPDCRLVAFPRAEVVDRYAKHLWAQLLTHEVAKNASLPVWTLSLPPTIDFVVHRRDEHHLIAVRKRLGKSARAELRRLLSSLGQTWRAARIWPIESSKGWLWEHEWVDHPQDERSTGD